jgi:hypothetical protein
MLIRSLATSQPPRSRPTGLEGIRRRLHSSSDDARHRLCLWRLSHPRRGRAQRCCWRRRAATRPLGDRVTEIVRKRQRRRRNRVVARLPPLRPERKRPGRGGRSRPMVLLPRGCACGVPWGGPSRVADPPSTVADGQGRRSTTAPIAATSPRSSGGRLLLANISRAFALPCSTPAKSM